MPSARAHGSVRASSTEAGRRTPASAAWNRSPAAMISGQPRAWRPAMSGHAVQPSTTSVPLRDRIGGATRTASGVSDPRSSACQASAAGDMSSGFSTTRPARHAVARPSETGSGAPDAPNSNRTSGGGPVTGPTIRRALRGDAYEVADGVGVAPRGGARRARLRVTGRYGCGSA
jgi:hypothetical protein